MIRALFTFIALPYYVLWEILRGQYFNSGHGAGIAAGLMLLVAVTSALIQSVILLGIAIAYFFYHFL